MVEKSRKTIYISGKITGTGIANYCYHCGQRLDWSDEDV